MKLPQIFKSKSKPVNKAANPGNVSNVRLLGRTKPVWIDIKSWRDYEKAATTNPVAFSTIDILSNFFSNGRVKLKRLKDGKIITKENVSGSDDNEIVRKAFKLFDTPNVLQSKKEFLKASMFMKKTFGNSFTYAFAAKGFQINIENVKTLQNIWPQYMTAVLTGRFFGATEIEDVIKEWVFRKSINAISFDPKTVLQRRETNIELNNNEDLIFGESFLKSLKAPLSNIEMSYETENIVLGNRGARMIVSPDFGANSDQWKVDEPIDVKEKEELQKDFKDYGLLDGQEQAIVTGLPVKITVVDQDIRKLGIFESIANNALVVANSGGVPAELLKLYIKGSTFENQRQAVVRMYQDTIIPEFEDYIDDLNDFLKMADFGYVYVPSFDHIAILQENKSENATANKNTSDQYEKKFKAGACTYNEWRRATGDAEENWGDVRVFELSEEELAILYNKPVVNQSGENTDGEPEETEEPEDDS